MQPPRSGNIAAHSRSRASIRQMKRTKREVVNRGGVAYIITTWDDETGDAEIREYGLSDDLIRCCEWTHWPEPQGDVIGEAVWFSADGIELERHLLRLGG
jgi:hypothetical protein